VERDAADAGVSCHALREPEEEVGDERERRRGEGGQVPREGLPEQRRGAEERREEREGRERVLGFDAGRELRVVRGERERHEADGLREAAPRKGEVARGGDHRDAEAVARCERRGEVEERDHVALGH
jgi:hypothetical protein